MKQNHSEPKCFINGTPFSECGFCKNFNCDTSRCEVRGEPMNEQMLFGIEAIPIPTQEQKKQINEKRNWENAFQRWSDKHGIESNNTTSYGCCGYGSMCDYCEDNFYGRPCVRALNAMCREKGIVLDYGDRDFVKVWRGESDEAD